MKFLIKLLLDLLVFFLIKKNYMLINFFMKIFENLNYVCFL